MKSSPTITVYSDMRSFLSTALEPLYNREWQNAIPIGIYPNYLGDTPVPRFVDTGENEPDTFILLTSSLPDRGICMVVAKTPSYGAISLYAALDPESLDIPAHIAPLAAKLWELKGERLPKEYSGDERLATPMAAEIARRFGAKVETKSRYHGAQITASTLSSDIPRRKLPEKHEIRTVTEKDRPAFMEDLVIMQMALFVETRDEKVDRQAAEGFVDKAITSGHAWGYFVDGVLATAAFLSRPTRSGISIPFVYAKPEHRGNGYTQLLLDELCQSVLKAGMGYIMLYFEDGGSASRIYRRTGFGGDGAEFIQVHLRLVL